MLREIWNEISDLLVSHWGVLLGALFTLIAYLFGRWVLSRRPKLSKDAQWVLEQIKRDQTHEVKGITIHRSDGVGNMHMPNMANYWFFRMQDGDEKRFNDTHPKAVGMFYPMEGETLKVIAGTEELLAKGYLTEEGEGMVQSMVVYRLKTT